MLRIKQIGTICFAIFSFVFPTFATDPDIDTATASCDDDVFNSNTGPVDIEINWEPNEINLRWYNGNTLITPSNSASNTCTYDEVGLTIPSAPTRTGYTFKGWRARPQMEFSVNALGLSSDGLERWIKSNDDNYCWYDTTTRVWKRVDCGSDSHFFELQNNEWSVRFNSNSKTLYGMAKCSGKSGNHDGYAWPIDKRNRWQEFNTTALENASGDKKNCWCQVTGYKATAQSQIYASLSVLPWVYMINTSNEDECKRQCAWLCSFRAEFTSVFRNALFTPASD